MMHNTQTHMRVCINLMNQTIFLRRALINWRLSAPACLAPFHIIHWPQLFQGVDCSKQNLGPLMVGVDCHNLFSRPLNS